MKSKLLLLSFLMLFTFTTNYAQTSASQSGIAVQGIARNSDNTALTSSRVKLSFELYYVDVKTGNRETIGGMKEVPVDTDAFGVFSHVIPVLPINFSLIANNAVHLTILDSKKETISDELLKQVPYAIAASNGVPTGCIMPYVGAEAPAGWLLCNDSDVPNPSALYTLIGAKTPKLGGMFLRGAGPNTNDGYSLNEGPTLNTMQQSLAGPHTHPHDLKIGGEDEEGSVVSESTRMYWGSYGSTNVGDPTGFVIRNLRKDAAYPIKSKGDVGINGGVQTNIGIETRPVNYGVNYIIKL